MSYLFFDTSALVKRYSREIGSNWVTNLLSHAASHIILISELTLAEFAAAIATKRRLGTITQVEQTQALNLFLAHVANDYTVLAANRLIIDRAVLLTQQYILRGYDAVQLATALVTFEALAASGITDFSFVAADNNLLVAAQAENLTVDNPNQHP